MAGAQNLDSLALLPPPPGGYSKRILKIEKQNHDCIVTNKLSATCRLKQYPFNAAQKIQVVSFAGFKLPLIDSNVNYSKIEEVKTLSHSQTDALTQIIYNISFRGTTLFEEEIKCYDPRHAILFLDINGNLFEYLEICLECQNFVSTSEAITLGDKCSTKFRYLEIFITVLA